MAADTVVHRAFDVPRMRLTVWRGPAAASVLVRSVGVFAARTSLPVSRLRDIADVLEALAESLTGPRIVLDARLERDGEELQVAVCDLPDGVARSLVAGAHPGGLAQLLNSAADRVSVRSTPRGGEALVVTFVPPSSP